MGKSTIRAGWIARLRLPGVTTPAAKPLLPEGVTVFEKSSQPLTVELSLLLSDPAVFESPPRHTDLVAGRQGTRLVQSQNVRADDAEGTWLRLVISREFDIDRRLRKAFQETADPARIHAVLRDEIEAELKAHGLVLAWTASARFADSYPQLRQESFAYWLDNINYRELLDYNLRIQVATPATIGAPEFVVHVRDVAKRGALTIGKKRRKCLSLACNWLLQSADLPLASSSRFLAYFMALEALCNVLPFDNTARKSAFLAMQAALAEAVQTEQPNAAEASAILERMRSIVSAAPLRDRFAALAATLQLPTLDRDSQEFAKLSDLRHLLLHGATADVPTSIEDLDVEKSMRRLACDYTNGLIDHLAQANLHSE
jgi:hypothetical protein